jgi:chromosome segregation ATPase
MNNIDRHADAYATAMEEYHNMEREIIKLREEVDKHKAGLLTANARIRDLETESVRLRDERDYHLRRHTEISTQLSISAKVLLDAMTEPVHTNGGNNGETSEDRTH